MREGNLEIRCLTPTELDETLAWATAEGWNPGLSDSACFHKTSPDGFLGAFEDGALLGSISAVKYGAHFAFIGLFIVRPELRGRDLGPILGRAALERLSGFNIGVDGVERKIRNYEGYGFKMAHYNIRFEGVAAGEFPARDPALTELSEIPFDSLYEYDSWRFPARRKSFLEPWLKAKGHSGLAWIDRNGDIQGYGVIRPCVKGYKIGPLFAADGSVAEAVFDGLVSRLPPASLFYLDVPESNPDAVELAEGKSLRQVFRTARMYNLSRPSVPEDEIFGVTSFELG